MWTLTYFWDNDLPVEVVGTFDTLAEAREASVEPLTYKEGKHRWSSRDGTAVAVWHEPTEQTHE